MTRLHSPVKGVAVLEVPVSVLVAVELEKTRGANPASS